MGFKDTRRDPRKRYWPVVGFLMLIALGIIAYFIAPLAIDLARDLFPRFEGNEIEPAQTRLIFTAIVFAILATFAATVVAIFAPKRKSVVREGDMAKEREAMLKDKAYRKRRQRKLNRQGQQQLRQ